jgi:hypothetical protein
MDPRTIFAALVADGILDSAVPVVAARDLRPGDRVIDPRDERAYTVSRVEPGSLTHYDGTQSLRVWFAYPYDRESRECHPGYDWTLYIVPGAS